MSWVHIGVEFTHNCRLYGLLSRSCRASCCGAACVYKCKVVTVQDFGGVRKFFNVWYGDYAVINLQLRAGYYVFNFCSMSEA
ncbi:hypothetical protein AOV_01130 [Anaplasma ovis str. Haibei]|uniref:Uncharacterized protein n=1 Tax=Anaplasma ovis str. Haibei TaxID=1248439 RepID=A0A2Z2L7M4_9RICK|nr:hypothetical protein AOV_01130 [Anaplasma ovis str. Haibei]